MHKVKKTRQPFRKERGIYMTKKKEKPIVLSELMPEEKIKYEIAEELGLLDRVLQDGWKSLSSKETGRIGGLMTKKRKEIQKGNPNEIKPIY